MRPIFRFTIASISISVLSLLCSLTPAMASAATLYVDQNIPQNCVGNYSISSRNCTGTDGNAFKTIKSGLQALTSGSTVFIRAGTYQETASLGAFSSMTTVSAYQNEQVVWKNDRDDTTLGLSGDANNITLKNIHFQGVRYFNLNRIIWQQHSGNVWKSTEIAFSTEIKSGCNLQTLHCTKTVQEYKGQMKTSIQALIDTGSDGDYYQAPNPNPVMYFYSNSGNPANRTDVWRTGYGITIGGSSSGTGYVVIDGCTFDGAGHAQLKGQYRWLVKNSTFAHTGTDFNDHHIYSWGVHSLGNEAIYENNYFENDDLVGAAIHIFGGVPNYHIIRNNIIRGNGFWGVLLDASSSAVTNNSMYIPGGKHGVSMQGSNAKFNVLKNNIVVSPTLAGFVYEGNPQSNTIMHNLVYGGSLSSGTCVSCTQSNNITGIAPGWINSAPTTWSDFRLNANSPAISAGENLGADNQHGFNPDILSWFPGTVNQNSFGNWEIGAFVFTGGAQPTTPPTATPDTCPWNLNPDVDTTVDLKDYSILVNDFFLETPTNPRSNLNPEDDDFVDLTDYSILVSHFFQEC